MRKILLLILMVLPVSVRAGDLKILFLNTDSIKIGASSRKVGDVFNEDERIFWKDAKQAMKVISLETNKQYVLVSEDFKQRKLRSAKDFLVRSNRLSTRGFGKLSAVADQVGYKIYWIDSVSIPIDYVPDEGEFFLLKFGPRVVRLPWKNGNLVFDSDIWKGLEPAPTEADLFYCYSDGEEELVSSGILLIPLPDEIVSRKR